MPLVMRVVVLGCFYDHEQVARFLLSALTFKFLSINVAKKIPN